jgi:ER-Golgi trafficking TRAPP I complex 85 kDa subunit
MTESDVPTKVEEISSALLLEQAAIANLRLAIPARRRFGFLSVMAAHRYETAGQVITSTSNGVSFCSTTDFHATENLVISLPRQCRPDLFRPFLAFHSGYGSTRIRSTGLQSWRAS